jgi:hypothetical protein
MSKLSIPPKQMYGARLLEYARVDRGVTHVPEAALLVGRKKLRRVPRLAIGHSVDSDEFLLFFCDNRWNPLGVAACKSRDDAKRRAEREYRGIASRWIELDAAKRRAKRPTQESGAAVLGCSFCKKDITQVDRLFESGTSRICDKCVGELHRLLKRD